jgi:hypothetical protein
MQDKVERITECFTASKLQTQDLNPAPSDYNVSAATFL